MKSFRVCGISIAMDGTEDSEIHRLKEGGVAVEERAAIAAATSSMASSCEENLEDDNPFVEEDNYEFEENATVLYDC